jgi:membrane protease YdiL (CAAX protease family)
MNAAGERTDGFGMAVAVEGGIAAAAVVGAWIFHIPLREQFAPWGSPLGIAVLRGLIATLPMLAAFWILVNSEVPRLRQLREQVEWLVKEMFPTGSVLQFAMVAALAGIGEELLFRGVVQTKLGDWTTPVIGLVLASFLFGLAHALSAMYFLFAIVVGAFLGWLALQYHDLVAPIVAHGLYDFVALVYLSKNASREKLKAAAARDANTNDPGSSDKP